MRELSGILLPEELDEELLSVLMLFSDSVRRVELVEAEVWNGFRGVFDLLPVIKEEFAPAAALGAADAVEELPEFKEEAGGSSDFRKKSIKSLSIVKLGSTINSIKLICDSGIRTVFLSQGP